MTKEELATRIIEVKKQLEDAKKLYQELDTLTEEFVELKVPYINTDEGISIILVDNFKGKNTCFKPMFPKRYEVEVTPLQKSDS